MSEEILPKSKNTHAKSSTLPKNLSQITNKQVNLTKILNPLTTVSNKQQYENESTKHSGFHSRQCLNATSHHEKYLNVKSAYHQPVLKNPQFHFNRAELNESSDMSFTNNSFQECREQIQQHITERFKSSKSQIEGLIQQSPTKHRERPDKRQLKRYRLQFYQCDDIIIRPCGSNKPVKVIDLAIHPTKNTHDSKASLNISNQQNSRQYAEKPFVSKRVDQTSKKISQTKLLDLIAESPQQNSRNYNQHQLVMDSPSFLDQFSSEKHTQQSFKQIILKKFDHKSGARHQNDCKEQNFQTKSNTSHQSKVSHPKSTNSLEKRVANENNMEDSHVPFRKRNKIFANDKKYGLKLSRAIKHEAEIEMLRGEMGVDVFHIIIEEDELLRQCCT